MQISLIAAFLGGLISLLSPCNALVLPTFFVTWFRKKQRLTLAALSFSAGLLMILIPLGLGAYGVWSLLSFYRLPLSRIIAASLALAGFAVLAGRNIPFPDLAGKLLPKGKTGGFASAFSLGMVSGLGSSACTGPILGAILTLAASATNPRGAVMLAVAYAAGIVAPLMGFALAFHRYRLNQSWIIRGKVMRIGGRSFHSTNLFAGFLLLFIAYIFLRYQGSLGLAPIFTKTGILDRYFDIQDALFTL